MTPLVDGHGRTHTDLRISVTDRCNFRCTYCMSEEGMQWVPREEILTFEEIRRVAAVAIERCGVRSIRLTGGEPTLRHRLPVLVEQLAGLRTWDGDAPEMALTTNGATLAHQADALRDAGLARLNISLDSLRGERFVELTRRDELDHVLEGIGAARDAGFEGTKLNCVVISGVNDDELVDFAEFGRREGIEVRFIEFMPLDADGRWLPDAVVSAEQIVATVAAVHPIEEVPRTADPATRYRFADGRGSFGVIASVTRPFCGDCDRLRLTAEGALRNCLFATEETEVRDVLRSGGSDDDVESLIRRCVSEKWEGHRIGAPVFVRPSRSMSQIGG